MADTFTGPGVPDTQKEAALLADARRYASDATDRAHAMQDDHPQDAALMARAAFYLDWLIEAYEIASATARAGLEDTARVDFIEAENAEVTWGDLDPNVPNNDQTGWWCYDGQGNPLPPNGDVFPSAREAIDAARGTARSGRRDA